MTNHDDDNDNSFAASLGILLGVVAFFATVYFFGL